MNVFLWQRLIFSIFLASPIVFFFDRGQFHPPSRYHRWLFLRQRFISTAFLWHCECFSSMVIDFLGIFVTLRCFFPSTVYFHNLLLRYRRWFVFYGNWFLQYFYDLVTFFFHSRLISHPENWFWWRENDFDGVLWRCKIDFGEGKMTSPMLSGDVKRRNPSGFFLHMAAGSFAMSAGFRRPSPKNIVFMQCH